MSPDPPVVRRRPTIVFRDGDVLWVRRRTWGEWPLPGGDPESREAVLFCARREVGEEVNR